MNPEKQSIRWNVFWIQKNSQGYYSIKNINPEQQGI